MTEHDIIKLFKGYLETKMTEYGYPVSVKQSFQPKKVGANSANTLYFFHINSKRVGHPQRSASWDELTSTMGYTDKIRVESTFQISGLINYDSSSTYTPADFMFMAAHILQTLEFKNHIAASGAAILKIGEIRNPYFENDKDRFQASPSFDFVIAYDKTLSRDGNVITTYEFDSKFV